LGERSSGDGRDDAREDDRTAHLPVDETPPRVRSSWDPLFAPGEVVGGRYRVIRFVAGGGAGEVYEVEDRELGGRVALKALRHALGGDARRFERFRREIHLARRVTHPNVCRLYDAGHHVRAAASPPGTAEVTHEEIFYLTMEFLAGETLATRLAADGRMTPSTALPIVRQIAAGLDAAHAAGVIHRDLKCANVMLVPSERGGDSPPRAVVTDFGLARAGVGDDAASTGVTVSGTILGTPSYMAPEQVEGGEITAAADVYAFGVMLFEIVTGELPFTGDSPLSVAVARLKQEPPSPRQLLPHIDTRWERVIRRCMALAPSERPGSAGVAVAALTDEATDRLPVTRRGISRRELTAAAVLLATLAFAWVWNARRKPAPTPIVVPMAANASVVPAVTRPRPAVAVLGFKNLSGAKTDAWLSTAFAEMLGSELAAGERVRTVPGETVARVKAELTLPEASSLASDTLARLRRSLGSDYVLLGSYVVLPGSGDVRLELHLQNAATGEEVLTNFEGTQKDLFTLVGRAGEALRAKLGAQDVAAVNDAAALRPANAEAARDYARGLAALRVYDAMAARDALEQAVAADPTFPFTYAALADAWRRLGYDTRATDAATRAETLSGHLPREQRLLVDGRARLAARDATGAAKTFRELSTLFPDDPEHPLHLAEALFDNDPKGSLAVAEAQLARPGEADDPRVSIAEAAALGRVGDSARQRDAARRAVTLARTQHANLLAARARHFEAQALQSLGDSKAAMEAFNDAFSTYEQVGDRYSAAQEQRAMAALLRFQGKLAEALTLAEQAQRTCRAIGAKAEEARALNTIGNIEYQRGEIRTAGERYESVLAIFREIDDRHSQAALLSNLANVRMLLGDPPGAIQAHTEALALKRTEGTKAGIAITLIGLGTARTAHGELHAAVRDVDEGLTLSREAGEKTLIASALFALGSVEIDQGDFANAQGHLDEALAIRLEADEKGLVAESRTALARLALERGDVSAIAAAEKTLADAAAELATEGSDDDEADARTTLARCRRLRGDLAGARSELARAQELAGASDDASLRVAAAIERARLDGATAQRPAALELLKTALQDAERLQRPGLVLEARLAVAELGTPAEREAVAKEAAAKGYGALAARARRPA
jgi:tetratricopeptide (TPR) repeat protein